MRWSDYVSGEWWITPGGGEEYADQDVSDAGHERVAIEALVDQDLLIKLLKKHYDKICLSTTFGSAENDAAYTILDDITRAENDDEVFSLIWNYLNSPTNHGPAVIPPEIGAAAVDGDAEIWDLLNLDPRWAYARKGAVRVINQSFACWKVTADVIKRIQDFILGQAYEAGDLEAEDVADLSGNTTIEEYSTNEYATLPINDFLTVKHKAEFWNRQGW